jgi:hypothetical protein
MRIPLAGCVRPLRFLYTVWKLRERDFTCCAWATALLVDTDESGLRCSAGSCRRVGDFRGWRL